MRKCCLILLFLATSLAQAQAEPAKPTLKQFTQEIIGKTEVLKNAEKITIIVNGQEIKDPEAFEFEVISLKEMSITRGENIKGDPDRTSFIISITTLASGLVKIKSS